MIRDKYIMRIETFVCVAEKRPVLLCLGRKLKMAFMLEGNKKDHKTTILFNKFKVFIKNQIAT